MYGRNKYFSSSRVKSLLKGKQGAGTTLLIKRCAGETYYYSEYTTLLNCVSQLGRSRGGVLFLEAMQTRRLSIVFPFSDLRGSSRVSTLLSLSLSLSLYVRDEMRKFAVRRVTSVIVFSPVARARVHRHKERERERETSVVRCGFLRGKKEARFARSVAALREQNGGKRISRRSAGYSQTGNATRPAESSLFREGGGRGGELKQHSVDVRNIAGETGGGRVGGGREGKKDSKNRNLAVRVQAT